MRNSAVRLFRFASNSLYSSKMSAAAVATPASHNTTENKQASSNNNGSTPADSPERPKLLVFDMNYTLWPHHIIEEPTPPLRREGDDEHKKLIDGNGEEFTPFEGIEEALKKLKSEGHVLAIASTCKDPEQAQRVLDLLDWDDLFSYKAMIPGKPKTKHFNKLRDASKIDFDNMLFFDDKRRNIEDVKQMGVTCAEVGDELTWKDIERGLKLYKKNLSD